MCQVQPGAYVSLLTPGETKYSDCHPRKTTTYILHVVFITTHTHDRRKSIGEKETKKRKEDEGKERKEKKNETNETKRKRQAKRKKIQEKQEKTRQESKGKRKEKKKEEEKRKERKKAYNCLARTSVTYVFSDIFGVHPHAEFETKSPLMNGSDAGCASFPWVYISAVPEYRAMS